MPGTLTNKLLPFAEQLAALRKRTANLVPTQRWTDMQRNAHTTAFTVAGAMKADLLKDLAGAVEDSIAKGLGIDYFRKQFDKIVAQHGWQYNGERNWRIRVIYQTNMATSYAAGRLDQLRSPELQKLKPFWMYRHSDSVLYPRPLHVSWDGLVLPADHAWFKTHYPPNGWGCHCRIVAVSAAEAKRRGKLFEPPDDGSAPDGTPKGIDPGWDYMPGDPGSSAAHLRKVVADKAAELPPELAQEVAKDVDNTLHTLESLIDAGKQFVGADISQPRLLDSIKALGAADFNVLGVAAAKKLAKLASARIPASWTAKANAFGTLEVRVSKARGFHFTTKNPGNYKVSGLKWQAKTSNAGIIRTDSLSTLIHEFMHRIQTAVPRIDGFFQALHQKRTNGDPLRLLRQLTGIKGFGSEVARQDHYAHPYFGREYGGPMGAKEVMTMTLERLLSPDPAVFTEFVDKDPELAYLGIGLLLRFVP